jgi:ribosome-associated toxin RatA of RatAB toxin-antitoxin module
MAGAAREEVFEVAAEKYYEALIDYKQYPKILGEVDKIDILDFSETSARIQYSINVVKSFQYTLKMTQKRPESLSWELESGSLFKKNSGKWTITSLGPNKCKVSYSLDVEFKIFAPAAITNKLVAVNLPRMMQSFYEYAKTK